MRDKNLPDVRLREALEDFSRTLTARPGMARSAILGQAQALMEWKKTSGLMGIFTSPPRLVTATLDDGIGQGLAMIHCLADLAGVFLIPLGLMQAPETIITECRRRQPDFLGLTVLHFDTEELLCDQIIPQLPAIVRVIAGGPVFSAMDEDTLAAKPYRVFNHARDFLGFLLRLADQGRSE